jgi:hypothetical protein
MQAERPRVRLPSENNFDEISDEFHEIVGFRWRARKYYLCSKISFKVKLIRISTLYKRAESNPIKYLLVVHLYSAYVVGR